MTRVPIAPLEKRKSTCRRSLPGANSCRRALTVSTLPIRLRNEIEVVHAVVQIEARYSRDPSRNRSAPSCTGRGSSPEAPNSAEAHDVCGDAVGGRVALHEADDDRDACCCAASREPTRLRRRRRRRLLHEDRQAPLNRSKADLEMTLRARPPGRPRRYHPDCRTSRQSRSVLSGETP